MTGRPALPADGHVHSEWSWDAPNGSMEQACRRAVRLGLPSIVFTEHADFSPRPVAAVSDWQADLVADGVLTPPRFDAAGYLRCLDACRQRYPELTVHSGVELGEPHWHRDRVAQALAAGPFDRVLASLHLMRDAHGARVGVDELYRRNRPADVLRAYLAELVDLITAFDDFDVLAHIDYAARHWPTGANPYRVEDFKEEYQQVLALLAAKGKVLEINTRLPLHAAVVGWWHALRGRAVTFGSDAHHPDHVARGFGGAAALATAAGFAPGTDPHGVWTWRDPVRAFAGVVDARPRNCLGS